MNQMPFMKIDMETNSSEYLSIEGKFCSKDLGRSRRRLFLSIFFCPVWIILALSLSGVLPSTVWGEELSTGRSEQRMPGERLQPEKRPQVIQIPRDFASLYPFSVRILEKSSIPSGSHVIDLAASRFLTGDLVNRSPNGTREFLPAPSETFPPDLVGKPFVHADQDYFLIQANDAMAQLRVRKWLQAKGLTIIGYVPELTYLVRLDARSLEEAKELPDVFWIGFFYPAFRISPRLDYIALVDPMHEVHMTVQLDETSYQDSEAVSNAAEAAGLQAQIASRVTDGWLLRVHNAAQDARSLALLPGCLWVERWVEPRLANDIARTSRDVPTGRGGLSGPLMDVEDVWDRGIHGEGQIAAEADTGLSTGDLSTLHKDFGEQGSTTNPKRVISGPNAHGENRPYALGRPNDWSDDTSIGGGHGTHVAGSILGNGKESGSDPQNNVYPSDPSGGCYSGIAPKAALDFQSVMCSDGKLSCTVNDRHMGIPLDLNALFQPPYDDDARVHSNSWGNIDIAASGTYSSYSQNVDRFVWVHKDAVILFSAGNDGIDGARKSTATPSTCIATGWAIDGIIDTGSVHPPGTAKNCITVGAAENYRPDFEYPNLLGMCGLRTWNWLNYCSFSSEPISSDQMANNANGVAPFSSRGPTNDGRIKPDIVAPGTAVISTRAGMGFQGEGTCNIPDEFKPNYVALSGTSMATPLVAGAAVLVRQYYVDGWHPEGSAITHEEAVSGDGFDPSAALVKATLINGAWDMTPGQYGTGSTEEIPPSWESNHTLPNDVEGFGRVDLEHSLFPGSGWGDDSNRRMAVYDVKPGLQTGEMDPYTFDVATDANPLIATLVWTDPDALNSSGPMLVNNLDLVVTSPNGTRYYPNGVNLISGSPDTRNNVEQVKVTGPAAGVWSISVAGTAIPGNGLPDSTVQPYALVISGVSQTELEASLTANPASGQAPLTAYLVASAAGTASGTINYSFWWDCDDPGTSMSSVSAACGALPTPSSGSCAENDNGYKCEGLVGTITSVPTPNHTYSSVGAYTGKVIIERGTAPSAEARAAINVLGVTPGVPTPLSPGASTGPGPEINTLTPTLQWQGVTGADWYGVYISVSPYGPDNLVYDNESVPGNVTSVQLPPGVLLAGRQYRWNMRAHNASGFSDFSGRLYFTTGTCLADAPANVQAIPQGADSIRISWDPSSGAVGYKVYRGGLEIADLASSVTTFTDTGLSAGTQYCYTVVALDACGGQTASAEVCSATMGSPPTWSWDFGDGGTSTVQNPSHTFAAAGSYTVTLTVTNADGTDTIAHTVAVSPHEIFSDGFETGDTSAWSFVTQ